MYSRPRPDLVLRHAAAAESALRELCVDLGVEPSRAATDSEIREPGAALEFGGRRRSSEYGRAFRPALELLAELRAGAEAKSGAELGDDIGSTYDRLAELSESGEPGRDEERLKLWRRLRELQAREADAWEATFRAGLHGPLTDDGGLVERLRSLRDEREDSPRQAAPSRFADET